VYWDLKEKSLRLWRISSNTITSLPSSGDWPTAIVFSDDGRELIAATHIGNLDVYDTQSASLSHRISTSDRVGTIGASSDFTLAATTGRVTQIWDLQKGIPLATLEASPWPADWFKFSRDKRLVLSTHPVLQVWDAASGKLLVSSVPLQGGEWVTITSEGFFDASLNGAKSLNVVRGLESYSIDQFYDALHRPDLVREKLAGDPQGKVREAAAKLDLSKAVASGSAPRVSIVAPASGTTATGEQMTVEASLADQGGGFGKVEWRVNGTTLGVDAGTTGSVQPGRTVSVRKTLTLETGENRIEVLAYNAQGLIASAPAEVVVTLQGQQGVSSPSLYVLAVGVNDYWDSRLKLAFAVSDAQALGDALRKAGQNLYEQVDVTMVLDGQATASQLDKTFTELSRKVRPQDVFVLFLSGHGKTVDGRFYFIPQDFRYTGEASITAKGIGQDQLQGWLARILARKSVLLFDACESGSLTEDENKATQRGMEEMTAIERLTRAMGRTVLTATTDDKPAAEGIGGHGVFTYALLAGIGEAQSDTDGLIEVTQLASYVDHKVPELSYDAFKIRQVPQMKIVGSDFPIARKLTVLDAGASVLGPALPTKPTHVVVAPTQVRQSIGDNAPVVIELAPGTQVRLIETASGWVLIAREGKKLGYVNANTLATLQ
jgi:Caspase domain/Bacterial Ig domain